MVKAVNPTSDARTPGYVVHLDAIRGFAAFLVLAGHARMLLFGDHSTGGSSSAGLANGPQALGLGHHAVIVFFVLSGFLVGGSAWRSIQAGQWSWRKYMWQRGTRLWIVLIPALLMGACLDHLGAWHFSASGSIYSAPPGQSMIGLGLSERSTFRVLAGNIFFLQTIAVPNYGTNAALWSLANEFWYYLTFPLLALAAIGNQPLRKTIMYLLLAALILLFVGASIAQLFFVWLLGFLVAILPFKISEPQRRRGTVAGIIQFAAMNALIRFHPTRPLLADTLLGLSFATLLYFLVHNHQPVRHRGCGQIISNLSSFSYTLYLTHLPFLTLLIACLATPWRAWPLDGPHILLAILIVVVTYAYAWAMYFLFERNTDRLRSTIQSLRTRLATGRI